MPGGTAWTSEEDDRLAQLVQLHGPKKWSLIATHLETKGSKQCRRRWKNFIALEERKQGSWTPEEDAQLLDGHRRHGNKWTMIAQEIGGRTDNAVKNRFAALEKKRKGLEEPSGRSVAQRLNDLGVRRIIHKDQPRHIVAEGPWLEQQQIQYVYQPGLLPQRPDDGTSGLAVRKPDLVINIPCATVAEAPYSQQHQGLAQLRSDKLSNTVSAVDVVNQPRPDDDGSMLSTSRQAAQNALAALASPADEPGTITSLYRFLCSATPHDAQQGNLTSGRRSPPPWLPRADLQLQGPQQHCIQLQQPPLLQQASTAAASALPQPQQQAYQQAPVTTGQPHLPDPQVSARQQLMQLPGMQQQVVYTQPEVLPQHNQQQSFFLTQPITIHQSYHQLSRRVDRGCNLEMYQEHMPLATVADPAVAASCPQGGSFEQQSAESRYSQQQQQTQQPATWPNQTLRSAPSAHADLNHVSTVSVACMPATATAANVLNSQQQQQQQQGQKQWGPEELRQLLDILGDHPPLQQCDSTAVCVVRATAAQPMACGPTAAALGTELEQANNSHLMHSMYQPEMNLQGLVQQEAAF